MEAHDTNCERPAASDPRALWVATFYDPGLELPIGYRFDLVGESEAKRLERLLSVVLVASTIPRRLGGDATSDQLAEDKRRCRRVGFALTQSLRAWTRDEISLINTESVRQAGAQLIWGEFAAEHRVELESRARAAVTCAVQSDELILAKRFTTRFSNEVRWITYALR